MEKKRKKLYLAVPDIMAYILIIPVIILMIILIITSKDIDVELCIILFVIVIGIPITWNNRKKRLNKYFYPIMNYEGNNRSSYDIEKLLRIVDEYNRTRPAGRYGVRGIPINLVGISSKDQLNIDKKYSVQISTLGLNYETEIDIKEQNDSL